MKKANYTNWFETACEHGVSEKFLRTFPEHVNWNEVSYAQAILEDLIREHAAEVDWQYIGMHQSLPKSVFVRKGSLPVIIPVKPV